jgi:N-formylglutamate amidohydrolase
MTLPFVVSIPHCGRDVPPEIRRRMALNDRQIIESVDFGTFEIFGRLPAAAVIHTPWSRLVADLNRSADNRGAKGVIALIDYHGRPVFNPGAEPDDTVIDQRVALYHAPYYHRLTRAMARVPFEMLLDGHSLNGTGPADAPDAGRRRKDVILSNNGDENGRPVSGRGPATCPADRLAAMGEAFERQGFSVSINAPYKGGNIINHYGPALIQAGKAAVQIEMNQDLYMAAGDIEVDPRRIEEVAQRVERALAGFAERCFGDAGGR